MSDGRCGVCDDPYVSAEELAWAIEDGASVRIQQVATGFRAFRKRETLKPYPFWRGIRNRTLMFLGLLFIARCITGADAPYLAALYGVAVIWISILLAGWWLIGFLVENDLTCSCMIPDRMAA